MKQLLVVNPELTEQETEALFMEGKILSAEESFNLLSSLSVSAPEKEGENVCCGMLPDPTTGKVGTKVHDLCGWSCMPEWVSPPRKTLEECKDEVAVKHGLICWKHLKNQIPIGAHEKYYNEIALLYASQQGNGWISVEDRLPEKATWVLAYINLATPMIRTMYMQGNNTWFDYKQKITHWMPLPLTPNT